MSIKNSKGSVLIYTLMLIAAIVFITSTVALIMSKTGTIGESVPQKDGKVSNSSKNGSANIVSIISKGNTIYKNLRFEILMSDGTIYSIDIETNNLTIKKDLPFKTIHMEEGFYLDDKSNLYVATEEVKVIKSENDEYSDEYVKIKSDIVKFTSKHVGCVLAINSKNQLLAYTSNDKLSYSSCGFDKSYNFDMVAENVEDAYIQYRNVSNYGWLTKDGELYATRDHDEAEPQKLLVNVKTLHWPYVLTKDGMLYEFNSKNENHKLAFEKYTIDENVDEIYYSNYMDREIVYWIKNSKIYMVGSYDQIGENYRKSEKVGEHYLTYFIPANANDIVDILVTEEKNYKVQNKAIYVDKSNKIHLLSDGKDLKYDFTNKNVKTIYDFWKYVED